MAVKIVEIVGAVLKEDAERLGGGFGFSNEAGVNVTAADVGEATDVADDFAKGVRAFPSDGEGSDAAGAVADGGAAGGIGSSVKFSV